MIDPDRIAIDYTNVLSIDWFSDYRSDRYTQQ